MMRLNGIPQAIHDSYAAGLMRKPWNHIFVFVLIQLVVFATYGHILSLELWNPVDFEILNDAHTLNADSGHFFKHPGIIFSQPLLQLGIMLEYRIFGLAPAGYLAVNLAVHGMNAFMVYLLVYMLFHRDRLAPLAAILFALSVGHYGKIFMSIAGIEPLLLAFFYLVILYCLIRNDFHYEGRLTSPWYLLGLVVFVLAGLTKPVSFSILGSLIAYKFFFYKERGRRAVFPPTLLILIAIGVLFYIAQKTWGYQHPPTPRVDDLNPLQSVWFAFKNIFRYLNLMLFPLQVSGMVDSSHPVIQFLYDWRVIMRSMASLGIISFSFFGLIFGNRAVRFFIAWTYIAVMPFAITSGAVDWLNIQYLYMAAVGFCVILAAGTVGCIGLLTGHRWRRLVPLAAPLLFVVVSQTVITQLADKYRDRSDSAEVQKLHRVLENELLKNDYDSTPTDE